MRKSRWLLALRIFCFLEGKVILMDTGNQFLGTERIGKLMRQYAVPCIISLLVGALYNIVDQIFIANASYLGSYGNAANTVVFPLTVVALGIAVFIGDGCCAFVSIALGRNAREDAHRSVGNAIVLCVVSSLVLTAVYLMFSESILVLFGGTVNEETHTFAKEYFFCITLGIPFYMFGQAMNPVIRSDGSPKFAMVSTVSGAIANVIFDPIFIYGFHWGMMGAAVATVIGQVLTAVLAVWYLRHMKVIKLDKSSFRLDGKLIPKFLVLGLTSFLAQISLVIAMAATNSMLVKYGAQSEFGADIPLTVLGIVMKVFQIIIAITIGMSAGCIPIVGYNYGAKQFGRCRGVLWRLMAAEFVLGAVSLVITQCFPLQLISIFGSEDALYERFAVLAFRIYLCMLPLATVNKAAFIFMQALGQPVESAGLSFFREVLLAVPLVMLLPRAFGLMGVLYSMPAADVITFLASLYILLRTDRQLRAASEVRAE